MKKDLEMEGFLREERDEKEAREGGREGGW